MKRRERKARAKELYEFFDEKSELHKHMANNVDFSHHKKVHEAKRSHYLDLSSRAIKLAVRMQNDKPMLKDTRTKKTKTKTKTKTKKGLTHSKLIRLIGIILLSTFVFGVIAKNIIPLLFAMCLIPLAILFPIKK